MALRRLLADLGWVPLIVVVAVLYVALRLVRALRWVVRWDC